MEIFDVVDENDKVIGQATRDECHSNPNLIHHTCQFTLINRKTGKVLLTKIASTKPFDSGKLSFPGEHMLSGESYEEGVKRGIREELGYNSKRKMVEIGHAIFRFEKQTELTRFFIVDWEGEKITFDKREIESLSWVDPQELKALENESGTGNKYWYNNIDWTKI